MLMLQVEREVVKRVIWDVLRVILHPELLRVFDHLSMCLRKLNIRQGSIKLKGIGFSVARMVENT